MLRFLGSRSRLVTESSLQRLRSRWTGIVGVAAVLGSVACGNDDGGGDDGGTVALADSGDVAELTNEFGIPTTVTVANGVAWVVESQFDRYQPFGGTGAPAPFRLIGIKLDAPSNTPYEEIGLPDDFYPEGITATPGGRLYVGSVAKGDIYTIGANSTTADIFADDLAPSTLGMTIGNDNSSLWFCSTNTAVTPPTGLVIGLAVADRGRLGTHVLPPSETGAGAFCNDLIMSPDGALWVTESKGGRIFRIAPDKLGVNNSAEVWLEADELAPPTPAQFGTNGITLLAGRLYTAVTDRGTLYAIDPTLEAPTSSDLKEIDLGGPLFGPDGITKVPGSDTDLLIVENGLAVTQGGKKLLRARLNRL